MKDQAYEKVEEEFSDSMKFPKSISLSWKSINIEAKAYSHIETLVKYFHSSNYSYEPRYETILSDANGFVEPGKMLAMLGARWD